MEMIKVIQMKPKWAFPKDIALLFGYKSPTKLLTSFREFCDARPNYFKPYTPYRQHKGAMTNYNILCFAHYYENQELLDAGSRSINFKDDLPRLKEVYG